MESSATLENKKAYLSFALGSLTLETGLHHPAVLQIKDKHHHAFALSSRISLTSPSLLLLYLPSNPPRISHLQNKIHAVPKHINPNSQLHSTPLQVIKPSKLLTNKYESPLSLQSPPKNLPNVAYPPCHTPSHHACSPNQMHVLQS